MAVTRKANDQFCYLKFCIVSVASNLLRLITAKTMNVHLTLLVSLVYLNFFAEMILFLFSRIRCIKNS